MKFSAVSALLALAPAVLAGGQSNKASVSKNQKQQQNKHVIQQQHRQINYTSVPGLFLQDDASTDPSTFDYALYNFGLLNRTYPTDPHNERKGSKTQWERFVRYVEYLNQHSGANTEYKLLVMGRHGEGYHNAAQTYYGTPAWNCYWAELDGNATVTWADAHLTASGIAQAQKANAYFKSRFEHEGMPYFQSYYTSPLSRCVQTADLSFSGINLPKAHPFVPEVKELFREGISIHTCDRRSNKTYIHSLNPKMTFEKGFTEYDELWRGDEDEGETSAHQYARSKTVLDDVFTNDKSTWVSITSHSGEIASILSVLNHRTFSLATGQIIPVLVKADLIKPTATTSYVAWTTEPTCTAPPVTSIAGTGCVCTAA